MYAQKMAAAIKVHGQSLRELGENVYLPFGSEYSIYLKNLNTVRASVKIEIDGQDVTQGVSLVIDPNDSFELERFIKNGNLAKGNRFKFIEKTAAVAAHRGDRVDDGLVRITYKFERQQFLYTKGINNIYGNADPLHSRGIGNIFGSTGDFSDQNAPTAYAAGVTAPGSVSEQEFTTVSPLSLETQTHVIILRLVGEHDGKPVQKASTTRTVTTCETCGTKTRSATANYCSNCGSSLQLID